MRTHFLHQANVYDASDSVNELRTRSGCRRQTGHLNFLYVFLSPLKREVIVPGASEEWAVWENTGVSDKRGSGGGSEASHVAGPLLPVPPLMGFLCFLFLFAF